MRSIVALTVALLAAPAAAKNSTGDLDPEIGYRVGAAMGAGSAGRYRESVNLGIQFAVPVHEKLLFGMDASGAPNFVREPDSNRGALGRELYDARINEAQLGAFLVYVHQVSDYLDLRPSFGMSFYQVNTFEGCASAVAGGCADRTKREHVSTDNYFGFNYGVQLGFKIGDFILGPEARLHQAVGGGRLRSPAFFTPSFFMSRRF